MRTLKLTRLDAWRSAPPAHPHTLHEWLTDRGSLTARLVARYADFNLLRVGQKLARPNRDERRELGLRRGEFAVVREVLLKSGGLPLVFAHSVVARADLRGVWRGLSRLGARPLAEMLFHDPTVVRLPIEYRCIDLRHPLWLRAQAVLRAHTLAAADLPQGVLWARRSVFLKAGRPLLVTEVFLAAMLEGRMAAR